MLFAAVDIHKHLFQAVILDPVSGEVEEARFPATRERFSSFVTNSRYTVDGAIPTSRAIDSTVTLSKPCARNIESAAR